mmetsp:Transcript_11402/g.19833  ORF Transcript_11402/g.19833 Transcript_11402/m.19833 type:complete len:85 (+) Transcript_11402:440-694(+)
MSYPSFETAADAARGSSREAREAEPASRERRVSLRLTGGLAAGLKAKRLFASALVPSTLPPSAVQTHQANTRTNERMAKLRLGI